MGRLDGKIALISGGARGQGATEAQLFAREGAKVVFGDVLNDAGRQVEADIRAAGGEATYVHLDVTSEDDWREAVGTAVNRYGKLDILVNNAGIIRRFSIEETTREVWDEVMAVNSTGVFLGTKYAIPAMRRAGGGSIINISSISGIIANTPMLQSGHEDPEVAMRRRLSAIPLGRLGTTEDIAYGALYLASDESSFVTGAELVIDGGFIAQ